MTTDCEGRLIYVIAGGLTEDTAQTLRAACDKAGTHSVACETSDPQRCARAVSSLGDKRRSLVVLSGAWIRNGGFGMLAELRSRGPEPEFLVIGISPDPLVLSRAIGLGLRGLVDHGVSIEDLARALKGMAAGELWISRRQLLEAIQRIAPQDAPSTTDTWQQLPTLTQRENDVLTEVLDGKSNKMIANRLAISEQTVKIHLQHVYRKLGVHRRVELMRAL